ncbi:MAG: Ldh family oxidoreductase [Actinomycetota bacterium]
MAGETIALSLSEIEGLASDCLRRHGCDDDNAAAVARSMAAAERDGAVSHGLFRLPGHVASLVSGKVNGVARPRQETLTPAAVRLDGDRGFAPLALEHGIPLVAEAADRLGVAVLCIRNSFHFAALWPEVEALADRGLVGLACTAHTPMVAPHGARVPFFSTNPVAFAFPRPGIDPYVFDLATAAKARGDIGVAARDGVALPEGIGLDADGNPTTDAAAIHQGGTILPFGGYKGSAIATMVELLAAGLVGDYFSFEAGRVDNGDGGPAVGGQFILALSPDVLAGPGWADHVEGFLRELSALDGVRLPSARRFARRLDTGPRLIDAELVEAVRTLGI